MNAAKLAVDMWADILSIVTLANFGASVTATPTAAYNAGPR